MKILDFERKGNVVKFYLGDENLEDWNGDDWNDTPYECNAGVVYPEYVKGTSELYFPFDFVVAEPHNGWQNSAYSKDDMKARKVPCIVAKRLDNPGDLEPEFQELVADDKAIKIYFGDLADPTSGIVDIKEETNE